MYTTATSQKVVTSHRSKTIVALLAALLGVFGAHWWYLRRPKAWLFTVVSVVLVVLAFMADVWYDNPAFFLLIIPATVGFIEALVFSLKTDQWFDQKYNPTSDKKTKTGWGPVLIALFTTFFGSSAILFVIALVVLHVYKAMGWLEGYVY
ncbi:MAG TPA: NINE protein [Burkholderiaceae bacterium]|nr:NINE protein [Burkholderiaceae bacterium]